VFVAFTPKFSNDPLNMC